jgi:hypothetical protein
MVAGFAEHSARATEEVEEEEAEEEEEEEEEEEWAEGLAMDASVRESLLVTTLQSSSSSCKHRSTKVCMVGDVKRCSSPLYGTAGPQVCMDELPISTTEAAHEWRGEVHSQ